MAARRVSRTSLDWSSFSSRVPTSQRPAFNALKNKQDGHVRRIAVLPEDKPSIDWAFYKARVSVPGLVESFQKAYESANVPFPKDTLTSSIVAEGEQQKGEYEKFLSASKERVKHIEGELSKWKAMMPIQDMALEEVVETLPHLNLVQDPNNPKPHRLEDLEEYEEWYKELEEKSAAEGIKLKPMYGK